MDERVEAGSEVGLGTRMAKWTIAIGGKRRRDQIQVQLNVLKDGRRYNYAKTEPELTYSSKK